MTLWGLENPSLGLLPWTPPSPEPRIFSPLFLNSFILSVSEAIYGSPLTIPGEFLRSPELPLSTFLSKIQQAVAGFAVPPPHHVLQSPPHQLPAALLSAKYMFVGEDVSFLSLAPLFCGPYLLLEQRDKFFCL